MIPSARSGAPPLPMRRYAVTVIGSGSRDVPELTRPLGRHLAARGVDLVTGGGGGVMAGVARAFVEVRPRDGRSVGILPADPARPGKPAAGYPNPWIEMAVPTHLPGRGEEGEGPGSRNHLVVLSGDVIVALSGGAGTASELRLAARYGRPVILLGWTGPPKADTGPTGGEEGAAGTRGGDAGPADGACDRGQPPRIAASVPDAIPLLDALLRETTGT
ncbi:MAG TPA: hypothetical protein VK858_09855 [Longimicrobiales bacterium]|nr:hypothetical protein [Longimicrobiales bacterium]